MAPKACRKSSTATSTSFVSWATSATPTTKGNHVDRPIDRSERLKRVVFLIRYVSLTCGSFDWGACMRSKSKRILRLLGDEEELKDARAEALRISREIQGFGNLIVSPSASSSPSSSSSSRASRTWSFGSSYSWDCPSWSGPDEPNKREEAHHVSGDSVDLKVAEMHLWDAPVQDSSCLLISKKEGREGSPDGWSSRLRLRLFGRDDKRVAFRSLSNVEKEPKKKFERQSSLGF
ncbi:hypothetical protein BHE74_00048139 [Ensete ventricosum]|nr:hypothetical protein BHE74_00048139 [Ensete ventricosum]